MTQSLGGALTGLYNACQTVYAAAKGSDGNPVLVAFGNPGQYQPNAIVAVGWAVRAPIARPTMGPSRSRNTAAEIDVVVSVYVPGGEEAAPVAVAQAFDLQALLEAYFRVQGNETLGGGCRDSYVSNAQLAQSIAYQANDDPEIQPVPTGRIATNTLTVAVEIRY